jgi:hypothetical protein
MNHLVSHLSLFDSVFDRLVSSFFVNQSVLLLGRLLESACDFLVARLIDLLWISFDLDESIPITK